MLELYFDLYLLNSSGLRLLVIVFNLNVYTNRHIRNILWDLLTIVCESISNVISLLCTIVIFRGIVASDCYSL